MQALFPPWTNTVVPLGIVAIATACVSAAVAPLIWVRTPYSTGVDDPPDQPIQFDHRHHVRDDGITCEYCHTSARRSRYAGVPSTSLCMGCHGQILNDSPTLAPLRRSYATGRPIAWARVHRLPEHVYFSHVAHVTRGVGCVTCHGRVDQMAQVLQVEPLTMEWCVDCHRDPDPRLRPNAAVADVEWQPRDAPREVGRAVRQRLGVNPPTHCTGCHR